MLVALGGEGGADLVGLFAVDGLRRHLPAAHVEHLLALAFSTCRPTEASEGAKYFSPWLGVRAGGAGLTRRVMPFEAKVSPLAPPVCLKAALSAFFGRMP
jgi:hypothetical protein